MTATELAEIGLLLNGASLPLALGATYKVFIDRFVPPGIDRSEEICARIRGGLATTVAACCRPYVAASQHPSAFQSLLCGVDGSPMEGTYLDRRSTVESDDFKEAFQALMHHERGEFHRYWLAFSRKRCLQSIWACVRLSVAAWSLFSFLGIAVFGTWVKKVVVPPELPWVILAHLVAISPVFLFVSCLVPYAVYSNLIAAVDE